MKCTLRVKKISNDAIDWMFVPCLPLISISSYVVQGTKETGNINNICNKTGSLKRVKLSITPKAKSVYSFMVYFEGQFVHAFTLILSC